MPTSCFNFVEWKCCLVPSKHMQEANLLSLSTEFKHKCQLYSCPLFSISIYIYFNIAVSRKRGVFCKLFPLECKTNKRYTLYSVRRDFIVCYTVIQFHLASLLTKKNNFTHFCEFLALSEIGFV